MKSRLVLATALTVGVLVLSACAGTGGTPSTSPEGTDAAPIKIGMVSPLTGVYAALGNGALAAVQMEVARINDAGGVDGRPIELVYKDDKSEPDQAVIAFNDLAADPAVVAILGSSSVTTAAATGPAALRAKVPMIALSPVRDFAAGENPYAFTVPASAGIYAQTTVEYMVAEGYDSVAIAHAQDPYGDAGGAATLGALRNTDIEVVLDEKFDGLATDFTPLLTKVRAADADALLVWGAGPAPVIITKQFAGLGLSTQLVFTGAQASELYLEPAGDAAEGVVMSSSIAVAGRDLPASSLSTVISDFADRFEDEYGTYPPQFAFDGAAGLELLLAAIEDAGSVDRAAIRDSLAGLDVLAPTGHYRFSDSDHMGLTPAAVTVVRVEDGDFVATPFGLDRFTAEGE